ncbi:MAG: S8 family serine peptidase [bacterium]
MTRLNKRLCFILLVLLVTPTVLAYGGGSPSILIDEPVVLEKTPQTLSPRAMEYLIQRDGQTVKVWVFFTDKDVFTKDQFISQAATVKFSEKVMARRAKMGLPDVVFADLPVVESYIDQVVNLGAELRHSSRYLNAASFAVSVEKLNEIEALPFVHHLSPVAGFRSGPQPPEPVEPEPSGDLIPDRGPLAIDYGNALAQLTQINVPAVHDKGYHGEGVTLAIFDTGYRKSHEVFAQHYAEGRVLAEWDFVFNDGNTANEGEDWSSQWNHGTYIWSTSGGLKDGVLYGPAFKGNFLLAKTEDVRSETPVEEDNWVAALEWADTLGADVITSSLCYSDWYTYADFDGNTATITLAANTAAGLGIVVCNAMGNSGSGSGTLLAPSDAFDILAVGAVGSSGTIASFSSRGPSYDGRTKPEVCARGVSTACASTGSDASYSSVNGTSLSTPLVAGAACLLIQARPTFTPQLIRQALMETADNAATPDNTYGWGIINADAALGWGSDFSADITTGEPPMTIQFTDNSTVTPTSWAWSFGDNDSAYTQNPSHTYALAGAYDVSLTIGSAYGDITREKAAFIILLGDTITFRSDPIYAGQQVVISVDAVNSQALNEIIVPITYDEVPMMGLNFDSITFGSRTGYFERLNFLQFDPANNKFTVSLRADNGGGSPPLTPGTGEIMRIYLTIDELAFGGLTSVIDTTAAQYTLEMMSDQLDYEPQSLSGLIQTRPVIRGDADNTTAIDVGDLTYMVAYLFQGGSPPVTIQAGDADFNFSHDVGDLNYLVAYLFQGGAPPATP